MKSWLWVTTTVPRVACSRRGRRAARHRATRARRSAEPRHAPISITVRRNCGPRFGRGGRCRSGVGSTRGVYQTPISCSSGAVSFGSKPRRPAISSLVGFVPSRNRSRSRSPVCGFRHQSSPTYGSGAPAAAPSGSRHEGSRPSRTRRPCRRGSRPCGTARRSPR